ncbi:MAG: DNA/RNA non-specific endonuclease [Clostridium sp.]
MDFFAGFNEQADAREIAESNSSGISPEISKKFDTLMRDDTASDNQASADGAAEKPTQSEFVAKFISMFTAEDGEPQAEQAAPVQPSNSNEKVKNEQKDENSGELREANSEYELDESIYETDDYGGTYKKNGELLSNTEYTISGNTYNTDESGRPFSCNATPKYTEEGSRNTKEQKESGGDERQEDDDGGHIIAKILGGAEGAENLVPMRRTINRGDYKKMENEISKALQEDKQVTVHIDLVYNANSKRPSKIHAEYMIDEQKVIVEFDNDEKSTNLLEGLCEKIEEDDYDRLKAEIDDMTADGIAVSITSIKTEYDEFGNPIKVTVGTLDESTGVKDYRCFTPRKE